MVAWGFYTGEVPTKRIKFPPKAPARQRWLTPAEAQLLLDEVKRRSETMYLMTKISLHTGMRWLEIAKLQGTDIDFEVGTILIKNDKAGRDRTVYMTEELQQEIATLKLHRNKLIFPDRHGNVRKRPSSSYERAVQFLGLNQDVTDARDKVVFHTLRHTFGSWLAQEGVPLYTIGQLMGHSLEETTRRYAKLCPEVKYNAVANITKHMQRS
jgi:integrase